MPDDIFKALTKLTKIDMAEERILERERYQIEQIRELDYEELQIEEVEQLHESSDDDNNNK